MARSTTTKLTGELAKTQRLRSLREQSQPTLFAGGGFARPSAARNHLDRALDYLDVVEPRKQVSDLVLNIEVARTLLDVLSEYRSSDVIRRHHLPIRNRLLFCGPPGCGKSITAEVLAREAGLPLLVAKLDTVIGSLLGETASNLMKIFEAVDQQNVVLFLDEFDALARTRSDAAEHSEMRRVVNNLLLMIERFQGRGFIVAATNLEATLDAAIVRRFDEVIYFSLPTAHDIRRLIRSRTRNFPIDFDITSHSKELVGRSHADIERICFAAMRKAIMSGRKKIVESDFSYGLESDQRRREVNRSFSASK